MNDPKMCCNSCQNQQFDSQAAIPVKDIIDWSPDLVRKKVYTKSTSLLLQFQPVDTLRFGIPLNGVVKAKLYPIIIPSSITVPSGLAIALSCVELAANQYITQSQTAMNAALPGNQAPALSWVQKWPLAAYSDQLPPITWYYHPDNGKQFSVLNVRLLDFGTGQTVTFANDGSFVVWRLDTTHLTWI